MDIEEYFGCRASSNPADTKRALRRDVWSEDDNHIAEALYRHYRRHTLPLMERPTNEPPDSANTESVLIPKLLHFVWLGADPIPTYNMGGVVDSSHYRGLWNAFIQSWSEHHPASSGWSIKVWTDESVVQLRNSDQPLTNQAAFDYAMTIKNYGMASDILRLDILHKFGGVYVDVDYMCLGSVETFHQMFNFYCGCSNTGCVEVNNGLMGCVSSHPLVRIMMEDIREWFDRSGLGERNSQITSAKKGDENLLPMSLLASFLDESSVLALQNASDIEQRPSTTDILRHTGPGLLTRSLYNALVNVTHRHNEEKEGNPERWDDVCWVAILPSVFFHPFPNHLRGAITPEKGGIPPTDDRRNPVIDAVRDFIDPRYSKAVHVWGCSWQK